MENELSRTSEPVAAGPIRLSAVWDVKADSTYDVPNRRQEPLSIALRTLHGAGRLWLRNGRMIELRAETLLFVKLNEILRYRCQGDTWTFWWFEFESESDNEAFPPDRLLDAPHLPLEQDEFRVVFRMLHRESDAQRRVASAQFALLLYRWLARWEGQRRDRTHQEMVDRIIDRMHEKVSDGWTVEEMAREAHMSARHFRQVFAEIMNDAPKRYYDRLRLETADGLLRLGAYSVSHVARQLGYSSPYHFSRAFRREFGLPPSVARGASSENAEIGGLRGAKWTKS